VEQGLSHLKNDLDTGLWDEQYGYLRKQKELHTGFVYMKLSMKRDDTIIGSITITKATAKDAEEILRLQKLAYISEAEIISDYTIPPLVQTLEETLADYRTNTVLKAVIDGKIVGSVRGELKEDGSVYIGKLMVNPDIQNQGLGTRLMNALETEFPGVKKFWLFTGQHSVRNLYLYHKLGYKDTGAERVNDKLSIVHLEKILK
jgi:ribosomal protein S18 acetylase RimI-like enzyme